MRDSKSVETLAVLSPGGDKTGKGTQSFQAVEGDAEPSAVVASAIAD